MAMSPRAEAGRIGTIGLTDARPALIRPVRDRLISAFSGALVFLAVVLPMAVLLGQLLMSAALASEMIGWWKEAGVLMPGPEGTWMGWAPARWPQR
jgi:hypothetical protein